MEESKLILVLKTFNFHDFRHFKRFLQSKIFNKHEMVLQFFDILRAQLQSKNPDLSKASIFKKLYPEKSFNDKIIRDLMYYLFKAVERFLAFEEMHLEKSTELLALCKSYRKRNLQKLFEVTANKTWTALQASNHRDVDFLHQEYQLEQEKYYATVQKKRVTATNLQQVSKTLDTSYFANRLRQSCIMLAHQNVYNTSYNLGRVEEVIREVEEQHLLDIPAISIYYYTYKAQTNTDNVEYFKAMQKELVANGSLFDSKEIRDLYILAINIGIKNLNLGRFELMNDLLELFKTGVQQQILFDNEILSRFTYKNMIALALRLQEYDWVEQSIETYKEHLDPKYREISYSYNLAKLHYAKKEYPKALNLLAVTALSDDVYINLDTKILLSRIYFEQNESDALESIVQSFKAYIQRKKVIGYQRTAYQNFISCINKLVSHNPYDKTAKKQLLEELKLTQPLPDKYWFLLMVENGRR